MRGRLPTVPSVAVRGLGAPHCANHLTMKATATYLPSCSQEGRNRNSLVAAVALKVPGNTPAAIWRPIGYQDSTVSAAT